MTTALNPLAPEYTPIPPGITNAHHPLPFPLPPPTSTVVHHLLPLPPPPTLFSSLFYSYVASTSYSSVQPVHTSTYYVYPQNPPPPPPPSPQGVVTGIGSRKRGQRGGFRAAGRGRGRRVIERNQRISGPICNERKVLGFQREEKNRHEIMPLKWDEEKTTVMIKNIPYDCPKEELIKMLDEFCNMENAKETEEGTSRRRAKEIIVTAYDFLYLPIDFRTKKSRGFAFVNFTNAKSVRKFFNTFHLATWDMRLHWKNWAKTIEIVTARIQGKEDLVRHFSGSSFECESDDFLPVTFSPARDGSGQPVQKMTIVGNRRAGHRWAAHKQQIK